MIFVDANLFIAAARPDDQYHERAEELLKQILDSGESAFTSDHVLGEVVSYLVRKEGHYRIEVLTREIAEASEIGLLLPEENTVMESVQNMKRFGFKSYCDGLTVALMKYHGISRIASFDSDFDRVPGIKRIN